ncbi:MAG: cellulase family glycosylhydrolase [Bacteroidales bacterium]|nr:cellulase family glycosylhydrolase [Bacteroidales bacterium]
MSVLKIVITSIALLIISHAGAQETTLEKISVSGKDFVTTSGEVIVLDGVSIRDPHGLEEDGLWRQPHFEAAKKWGADLVRLPVHPAAWRERGQEAYLHLLDQAVSWARELDLYLIIDWHSIGNLHEEKFQSPGYITSVKETHAFWSVISERFAGEPVIAMYELYNEPTVSGERFGELSWAKWKEMNTEMIDLVRKNDPETVILVAGFNWAYDLTPVRHDPIERPNVAYVSHPYPQKREQPWEPKWQEDWGFVAEKYPVILTEIGFALPHEKGVHVPVHGDETYGNALVDFCSEREISWVAWCFDNRWSPLMYTGNYEPTRQGTFFREAMLKNE